MTYILYVFMLFIIATICVYYIVPQKYQWNVLLLSSIIFYMCSGPVFLIYLLLFSFLTWYGVLKLEGLENGRNGRKICMAVFPGGRIEGGFYNVKTYVHRMESLDFDRQNTI